MQILRYGSKGKYVETWQNFLRGLDLYLGPVDGDYGLKTVEATKAFQKKYVYPATKRWQDVDGVVGNTTYSIAGAKFCFEIVKSDTEGKYGPNWPEKPSGLKPLSFSQRQKVFGKIEYIAAPTSRNPEAIKITNNWVKNNIVKIEIPQLKGVRGAPGSGKIFWHKSGQNQIINMFQAWEDEGLIDLVLTWAGSWAPRFIRGSRTTLSNHAHSVAFDINAPWNGLGRQPALVGSKGSVRELVDIAVEHGFFWGGWFGHGRGGNRSDGMHFEMNKIL